MSYLRFQHENADDKRIAVFQANSQDNRPDTGDLNKLDAFTVNLTECRRSFFCSSHLDFPSFP